MSNNKKEIKAPDNELTNTQSSNLAELNGATHELIAIQNQAQETASKLAHELHYDGIISIGAIEDEIRFYQKRTIEACLELGKRLLILKELSPHGEFKQRIELLAIDYRMAAKFMSATLKFSKVNSNSLLKAAGNQTKLLELVLLDDDEIIGLENGESVRGLTLDKIDTMSVRELKKALRESNETIQAKDEVLKTKSEALDKQSEHIAMLENRRRLLKPNVLLNEKRTYLQLVTQGIKDSILTELRKAIKDLYEIEGDHQSAATGCLVEISREIALIRGEYLLPNTLSEELAPEWLDDEFLAEVEKAGITEAEI